MEHGLSHLRDPGGNSYALRIQPKSTWILNKRRYFHLFNLILVSSTPSGRAAKKFTVKSKTLRSILAVPRRLLMIRSTSLSLKVVAQNSLGSSINRWWPCHDNPARSLYGEWGFVSPKGSQREIGWNRSFTWFLFKSHTMSNHHWRFLSVLN